MYRDFVLYDVTTLYFESAKKEPESIRQKGYSKDGKAHKTQIVLELLVDKMQISEIKEDDNEELIYMRSKIDENQEKNSKILENCNAQ